MSATACDESTLTVPSMDRRQKGQACRGVLLHLALGVVLLVHRAGVVGAVHGLALHAPVVLLLLHAAAVVLLDT